MFARLQWPNANVPNAGVTFHTTDARLQTPFVRVHTADVRLQQPCVTLQTAIVNRQTAVVGQQTSFANDHSNLGVGESILTERSCCGYWGPVRGAVILATIQTPWRFRTKRNLWAYPGLAVVTRSHASRDRRLPRHLGAVAYRPGKRPNS